MVLCGRSTVPEDVLGEFAEENADPFEEAPKYVRPKWWINWEWGCKWLGIHIWLLVDKNEIAFYLDRYRGGEYNKGPQILGLVLCRTFRNFTYSHDPPRDDECRGLGVAASGLIPDWACYRFGIHSHFTLKWLKGKVWLRRIWNWIRRKDKLMRPVVPCDWYGKNGGSFGIKTGINWQII